MYAFCLVCTYVRVYIFGLVQSIKPSSLSSSSSYIATCTYKHMYIIIECFIG